MPTRPIVSLGPMLLVEKGRVRFAYPVNRYLPEFVTLKTNPERMGPPGRGNLPTTTTG